MRQQTEVLVALHAHQGLFGIELDAVGFFGKHYPCVVAVSFNLHPERVRGGSDGSIAVDAHGVEPPVGLQVFFLAHDIEVIAGVDIQHG